MTTTLAPLKSQLHSRRVAGRERLGDDKPLAVLGYGPFDAASAGSADMVDLPVLLQDGPVFDIWSANAPIASGVCDGVRWRHDGQWLYGAIELDEAEAGAGLEALSQRAYSAAFKTLDQTGFPHFLRLWNYLPLINADGGGMERYRQFNAGRHQAFVDAGRTVLDGAPAACALGTAGGPYCLRFLAARRPALAIENPRQVSAYRYPDAYGPRSPTFSRAAMADVGGGQVLLLISGTASIVGHQSLHVGDVQEQAREALRNIEVMIGAARARSTAAFETGALRCTVYLRHQRDLPLVRAVMEKAVHTEALYLQADVCRGELLVEIEAHGFASGEVRA